MTAAQLLKAANRGDVDKAAELLEFINVANKKGQTALHVAVSADEQEMVAFLVSHGADCRVQEKKSGFTPLMVCLAEQPVNYLSMIETILTTPDAAAMLEIQNKTAGQLAIHQASEFNMPHVLDLVLKKLPTSATSPDASGRLPLHLAARAGNLECFELLLRRTNNVNIQDKNGNTPLHLVCQSESDNDQAMAKQLIEKGASVLIVNNLGNTALHSEAMHCDPDAPWPSEVAKLIMQKDPKVEAMKNAAGTTASELYHDVKDNSVVASESPVPITEQSDHVQLAQAAVARAALKKSKKKPVDKEPTEASAGTKIFMSALVILVFALIYAFFASSLNNNNE